jgi:hypothetical protein
MSGCNWENGPDILNFWGLNLGNGLLYNRDTGRRMGNGLRRWKEDRVHWCRTFRLEYRSVSELVFVYLSVLPSVVLLPL